MVKIVKRIIEDNKLLVEDIKHLEETRNKIIYSLELPDAVQLKNSAESIPIILKKLM